MRDVALPVKTRPRPFLCVLRYALKTGVLNLILSSISSEMKSQQAVSGDIFVQVQWNTQTCFGDDGISGRHRNMVTVGNCVALLGKAMWSTVIQ